jgi:hypothetical protein
MKGRQKAVVPVNPVLGMFASKLPHPPFGGTMKPSSDRRLADCFRVANQPSEIGTLPANLLNECIGLSHQIEIYLEMTTTIRKMTLLVISSACSDYRVQLVDDYGNRC